MPNHLHMLLSVKNHEDTKRFQIRFLKFTGQKLIYYLKDNKREILNEYLSTNGDRKYQFWQRNSKIIELEGIEKQIKVLVYIHNNPVQKKWMLANSPIDYKYSTALFYDKGLY